MGSRSRDTKRRELRTSPDDSYQHSKPRTATTKGEGSRPVTQTPSAQRSFHPSVRRRRSFIECSARGDTTVRPSASVLHVDDRIEDDCVGALENVLDEGCFPDLARYWRPQRPECALELPKTLRGQAAIVSARYLAMASPILKGSWRGRRRAGRHERGRRALRGVHGSEATFRKLGNRKTRGRTRPSFERRTDPRGRLREEALESVENPLLRGISFKLFFIRARMRARDRRGRCPRPTAGHTSSHTSAPSSMRDGLEWGVGRSWRGEFRRREAMARAESDWREAPVGFCAADEPPSVGRP